MIIVVLEVWNKSKSAVLSAQPSNIHSIPKLNDIWTHMWIGNKIQQLLLCMSSLSILINNVIVLYGTTELLHDPVAGLNDK